MSPLTRVRRYATRHRLWLPDTRLVAAVSGGSDSIAMLLLLHELQQRHELQVATVAHLNHAIRPEADADEAFCRAAAERLGVGFVSARVDVPALARDRHQSLELTGRIARREFLDAVRRDTAADAIATAHTEDDQAETVLLRLLRGAGSRGLGAIRPCRDRRVRPVLCLTREQLRRYLETHGQSWRDDSTNSDLANPRNRIRHQLLPYLARRFNPSVRRTLTRLADVAHLDEALMGRMAAAASARVIERQVDDVVLDGPALLALPGALQRRVVMHALAAVSPRAPSHHAVTTVLAVAAGDAAAADLSSVRAEHFAGNVVLVSRRRAPHTPARDCLELSVPGEVRTFAGWILQAARLDHPDEAPARDDVAQIDAAAVSGGLVVRGRQPGDRLRPVGLGGRKKVQDLFVDRKVRRHERDAVPIVTDKTGRIVWVAGHALGEEFRITERTNGVIILKLRRV